MVQNKYNVWVFFHKKYIKRISLVGVNIFTANNIIVCFSTCYNIKVCLELLIVIDETANFLYPSL